MLFRHLTTLAIASAATAFFAMDASANPRFSVESQSDVKLKIEIFKGDDSACLVPDKAKKLKAGKTKVYGCEGNGTGVCKVKVWFKGIRVCENQSSACNGTAIRMKDGQRLVLSDESGCSVE